MKKIFICIKKISDILNFCSEKVIIFLMTSISVLIFIQVIFRYVFNHSLYWSEEVGRYLLIWITFLGASIGVKKNAHIGIDFFYRKSGKKTKQILNIIIDITGLIFSFIMFLFGLKLSWFVRIQKSAALLMPMTIPYSAIWVGGLIIFFHFLSKFLEDIKIK